jgi:hypothetical protein
MSDSKKNFPEINTRFLTVIKNNGFSGYRLSKEVQAITQSKLTHIRSGRNKPSSEMLNALLGKFPNINYDWLLTGKGEMLKKLHEIGSPSISYIKKEDHNTVNDSQENYYSKSVDFYPDLVLNNATIPLFDQIQKDDIEIKKIYDPSFESSDFVLRNFDESNYPIIRSGDLVGYKKIDVILINSLNLNSIYLIITANQQRMLKKLETYKGNDDKFWATSINSDQFKPFSLMKKDVKELYEIIGISRRFSI